jgi:hypothetical protein
VDYFHFAIEPIVEGEFLSIVSQGVILSKFLSTFSRRKKLSK